MGIAFTDHALTRVQQRGISHTVLELLLTYGKKCHDQRGSEVVFFDHQARNRLRKYCEVSLFKYIEKKLDTYAVIATDGTVITVGHRTKRINRN